MRKDTMPYTDFTAPGVEVHCLYGEGFPTVERFVLRKENMVLLVRTETSGTVN